VTGVQTCALPILREPWSTIRIPFICGKMAPGPLPD
jgi:hypothetical protein